MVHVRDPQRFAREGLWERFNERSGPFTKFVTDRNPERTRLFLDNSRGVQVKAWMSDFDDNVCVLYKMQNDTWMLYTQWREGEDPYVDGPVAFAAISSTRLESVAKAVAIVESNGREECVWNPGIVASETREVGHDAQ